MADGPRQLPPADWLGALAEPAHPIETVVWGYQTVRPTWRIARRALAEHLLYFPVAEGCGAETRGERFTLEPGDCLLLAPGLAHAFWPRPGRPPPTLFHFRIRLHTHEGEARLSRARILQRGVWGLRPHLQQLVDELGVPHAHGALRQRALWVLIASSLFRGETTPAAHGKGLDPAQRWAIWDYTQRHLADWPRPADLAAVVNLSPDHFSRVFRRSFGQAPRRWLLEQRIRRAAALIAESDRRIADVAGELGYDEVFLFSRQFKKVMGTSPSAFRARPARERGA
jgi:AraC-like DNA-binding protein